MNYYLDFYNELRSTLITYAQKLDRDNAEDIFTDCHIIISEKYKNLDLIGYKKLMYTCIVNIWKNNKKNKTVETGGTLNFDEVSLDDQMIKNQEITQIKECLSSLSVTERHLLLDYKKGSSGAYRVKVNRAKKKLKKMIQERN